MPAAATGSHSGKPAFTALAAVERSTIAEIFWHGIDRHARENALLVKEGKEWTAIPHVTVLERVGRAAAGLERMGLRKGDRLALLSENRFEWAIVDYAAQNLGLIDVPIYPTLPADQIAYMLRDAGVRVAFASTAEQWKKLLSIRDQLPDLEQIVCFEDPGGAPGLVAFADLLTAPDDLPDPAAWLRERAREVKPDDIATLIYTSGTTGAPKGVMLTHYNLATMVVATRQHGSLPLGPGDVALSFLPLSHIFERAVDYYYWDSGVTIAYAESTSRVAANLREVRPHTMVSVPRVFEVIYTSIMNAPGARRKLIDRAVRVGGVVADARLAGRPVPLPARLSHRLFDRLVFSKLRKAVGGRVKVFICGGAALSPDVARFFFAAGLPIHEGYGLTETSPVLTANRPGQARLGSVGVPYPGVELRLGEQDEILARTPGLMKGYWNQPKATAAAIDADGWFHTGDVGTFDTDGFLHITDRLKDLIVTTGGKNIAPQALEARAQESPFVARAVMIGDRRPYPVMLIEPYLEKLRAWCRSEGIPVEDGATLLQHERVLQLLKRETLGALRGYATHERPKKIAVLPETLTVEAGFLTPTLKIRRRIVEQHFAELIDSLYG